MLPSKIITASLALTLLAGGVTYATTKQAPHPAQNAQGSVIAANVVQPTEKPLQAPLATLPAIPTIAPSPVSTPTPKTIVITKTVEVTPSPTPVVVTPPPPTPTPVVFDPSIQAILTACRSTIPVNSAYFKMIPIRTVQAGEQIALPQMGEIVTISYQKLITGEALDASSLTPPGYPYTVIDHHESKVSPFDILVTSSVAAPLPALKTGILVLTSQQWSWSHPFAVVISPDCTQIRYITSGI